MNWNETNRIFEVDRLKAAGWKYWVAAIISWSYQRCSVMNLHSPKVHPDFVWSQITVRSKTPIFIHLISSDHFEKLSLRRSTIPKPCESPKIRKTWVPIDTEHVHTIGISSKNPRDVLFKRSFINQCLFDSFPLTKLRRSNGVITWSISGGHLSS